MRLLVLLLFVTFHCVLQAQNTKTYILKIGKFYDSEKNVFLKNQEILVKGNKIIKVGSSVGKVDSAEVINLPNCSVSPGLIDAHTHVLYIQKSGDPLEVDVLMNSDIERSLRAVKLARTWLEAGYTTIRDMGNSGMYLDVNMQRAVRKGWIVAPRMIVSGPILAPEDGQFFNLSDQNRHMIEREYTVVRSPESAVQAVKDHISHGIDVIKVVMGDGLLTLTLEDVKAIVETAHKYGVKVTAHATYNQVIARAIDAGVDGIEHGYDISDSLLDVLVKKNIYLVPTIGTYEEYRELFDVDHKLGEEELKGLRQFVTASQGIVKRAFEKGVTVVNGSDMYLFTKRPQGEAAKNSIESYYVASGKANEVLKTATINAAKACGVGQITGILKENMMADLVIFDGDIEKDFVKTLFKVKLVMKEGEIVFRK